MIGPLALDIVFKAGDDSERERRGSAGSHERRIPEVAAMAEYTPRESADSRIAVGRGWEVSPRTRRKSGLAGARPGVQSATADGRPQQCTGKQESETAGICGSDRPVGVGRRLLHRLIDRLLQLRNAVGNVIHFFPIVFFKVASNAGCSKWT